MIYFAHRGASGNYPENTILAFKKAIEAGAKAIELDVHKTKDNKLVVIHDENIKRTYNGEGLVKDYTLEELKKFKCRNLKFQEDELCKIPTLEEVLRLIVDKNIFLNIELKTDVIHYENIEIDVINLVEKFNITEKVLLSSFYHKSIEKCKKINPTIKVGLLYDKKIQGLIEYAKSLGAYSLNPKATLVTKALTKSAHENNLKVFAYTVNSPILVKTLDLLSCDGVFTDFIERFI